MTEGLPREAGMNSDKAFSCLIIGEGTLPIQCAEVLLGRGHAVRGVLSPEAAVQRWAEERQIPQIGSLAALAAFARQQPFDYLFSIVNSALLPPDILALPGQGAVNYHDAPLPRYAGSHATSWALIHRETTHGVTWHVMGDRVDAGAILKQELIDIAEGETALTLNAKCYDAAIRSFTELVDELASGRVVARPQNLRERTFFPRDQRPAAGGVLSWTRDAQDLDALVRALDFGAYPNPLGLAKLALGGDFFAVGEGEVLGATSEAPAGTVTAIGPDFLQVATVSREIVLRKVQTLEGEPLPVPDLVARFGVGEGYRLRDLDPELARRLTALNASVCRHEAFWVERLATLQPLMLPYAGRHRLPMKPGHYVSIPLSIPPEVTAFLAARPAVWDPSDFLLGAFAVYLARIGGMARFDLGFSEGGGAA